MMIDICNPYMKAEVNTMGGELYSIRDYGWGEYLWQGDAQVWGQRAPNLFPYVGRLTNETYRYRGEEYHMGIHGFIQEYPMEVWERQQDAVTLKAVSNVRTLRQYPFSFEYYITYRLVLKKVCVTYRVLNTGKDTMYFGIGAHPGFQVPMEKSMNFEDYFLEFEQPCEPIRIGFTETCFLSGKDTEFPLDHNRIFLRHELFDEDVIVLKHIPKTVRLKSKKGRKSIKVSYPDMNYLGIWHMPRTEAPYVCIEPWYSLPSRQDVVEDLEKQPDLIALPSNGEYKNTWEIVCESV